MPRQSPAAKAYKLFTELLADFETAFMRLTEAMLPHDMTAGRGSAGWQLQGILAMAGQHVQAVWGHAQAQMAAWLHAGEAPATPRPVAATDGAQADSDLEGWEDDVWMECLSASDCKTGAHASDTGLVGVHPGEAGLLGTSPHAGT